MHVHDPALADQIRRLAEQHPQLAEHFPYLLVFILLYLSGVGLPLPEEISLVLGGYLMYLRSIYFFPDQPITLPLVWMCVAACAAILAGDLTIYWLGRRYGQAFLTHRWMRWVFSQQNLGRIDRFYERFGLWAVFISRFVAGARVGSFFLAGASGVTLRTFLIMDGLGTLISAPVSVWLAFHFGEEIHRTLWFLGRFFRDVALLVALTSLLVLWWQVRRARRMQVPPTGPSGTSS